MNIPDSDLLKCGYAPGKYGMKCPVCNDFVVGVDKYTRRCRPCSVEILIEMAKDTKAVNILSDVVEFANEVSIIAGINHVSEWCSLHGINHHRGFTENCLVFNSEDEAMMVFLKFS